MNTAELANVGIKLLTVIVKRGKGDRVVEYLDRECNIPFTEVCMGKGTASSTFLDILGLSGIEKDIVFSAVRADKTDEILNGLAEKFKLNQPGKGLAFTVRINSIGGTELLSRFLKEREENR